MAGNLLDKSLFELLPEEEKKLNTRHGGEYPDLFSRSPNELVKMIESLRSEKISVLGEGECFVHKNEDGSVRGLKTTVTLKEASREIYSNTEGRGNITALGYHKLNQVAGLSIVSPPYTRSPSGDQVANPYIEFSSSTKRTPSFVSVRKIVYGHGATGSMVAIDKTILFNLHSYLIQDLQNTVKAIQGCGFMGILDQRPAGPWPKTMTSYPLDAEQMCLWVDYTHQEIQECIRRHTQRIKFAERIATSIVERNCLRAHPAISAYSVPITRGVSHVTVYGHIQTQSYPDLVKEIDAIAKGVSEVETHQSIEEAGVEEIEQESSLSADEHGGSPATYTPPQTLEELDPDWQKAIDRCSQAKRRHPRKFYAVMASLDTGDLYKLDTAKLTQIANEVEQT